MQWIPKEFNLNSLLPGACGGISAPRNTLNKPCLTGGHSLSLTATAGGPAGGCAVGITWVRDHSDRWCCSLCSPSFFMCHLGKVPSPSKPQCSHFKNGGDNTT